MPVMINFVLVIYSYHDYVYGAVIVPLDYQKLNTQLLFFYICGFFLQIHDAIMFSFSTDAAVQTCVRSRSGRDRVEVSSCAGSTTRRAASAVSSSTAAVAATTIASRAPTRANSAARSRQPRVSRSSASAS